MNFLSKNLFFYKNWTDDRNLTCKGCFEKEKKFPVQWATYESARFWKIGVILIWTIRCLIVKKLA